MRGAEPSPAPRDRRRRGARTSGDIDGHSRRRCPHGWLGVRASVGDFDGHSRRRFATGVCERGTRGEVGVLRRAQEPAAGARQDLDARIRAGACTRVTRAGPKRPAPRQARHLVARRRSSSIGFVGPVGHRDRRPRDEALIVVADDHQVAVLGGEQLEPAVLGVVGVLVLVDEDVAEGAARSGRGPPGRARAG